MEIELDPSIIRFTHSKIRNRFSGNQMLIQDTLQQLRNGEIPIGNIPKIQVMQIKGEYYSMNNRRLYCFKELNKEGLLDKITVRIKQANKKEQDKYTPERCSLTAKLTMN
jgi:hypothetical protein